MINLIENPNFPDGTIILSKDLYKKFMKDIKFSAKCVFCNNDLPSKTAIVSADIFKILKGE